jgi:DNA-binding beta-propeller fold protein YncE
MISIMFLRTDAFSAARRPTARNIVVAGAIALALACTSAATEPDGLVPPAGATHPVAETSSRVVVPGTPLGVAVSGDGTVYVTQRTRGTVERFRLDAPNTLLAPIDIPELPEQVVFAPDSRTAYVGADSRVDKVDVATGVVLSVWGFSTAQGLAVNADQSKLFVSNTRGELWWLGLGTDGRSLRATLTGSLRGIALSHAERSLYTASSDGTVWRVEPSTLATLAKSSGLPGQLEDVVLSLDGKQLFVVDDAGDLLVLDATNLSLLARTSVGPDAFGLAMSPDGAQLYVTSPSGRLTILDRATRAIVRRLDLGGIPRHVAFDRTGTTAVIANEGGWVDVVR